MTTIIIAADHNDGKTYIKTHPHVKPALIITPRNAAAARGHSGPVIATTRGRAHTDYNRMLKETAPCAAVIRVQTATETAHTHDNHTTEPEPQPDTADAPDEGVAGGLHP